MHPPANGPCRGPRSRAFRGRNDGRRDGYRRRDVGHLTRILSSASRRASSTSGVGSRRRTVNARRQVGSCSSPRGSRLSSSDGLCTKQRRLIHARDTGRKVGWQSVFSRRCTRNRRRALHWRSYRSTFVSCIILWHLGETGTPYSARHLKRRTLGSRRRLNSLAGQV